jgi:hypothetical protein
MMRALVRQLRRIRSCMRYLTRRYPGRTIKMHGWPRTVSRDPARRYHFRACPSGSAAPCASRLASASISGWMVGVEPPGSGVLQSGQVRNGCKRPITNAPDLDRGVDRMSSGRTERFAIGASGSRGLRYAFAKNWGNLKAAQRFIFWHYNFRLEFVQHFGSHPRRRLVLQTAFGR